MPMSPPDGSAPIVVGIDAGPGAADALAWAAAEAGAQHCPLRVVHVFTLPNLMDPYGLLPADDTGFCRVRDAAAKWCGRR